jgi:hypothetical protein
MCHQRGKLLFGFSMLPTLATMLFRRPPKGLDQRVVWRGIVALYMLAQRVFVRLQLLVMSYQLLTVTIKHRSERVQKLLFELSKLAERFLMFFAPDVDLIEPQPILSVALAHFTVQCGILFLRR